MKIDKIFKEKSAVRWGSLAGFLYLLFYLYSTGDLTLGNPFGRFNTVILRGWRVQLFKTKAPFIWEGIGAFSTGDFYFIVSPMNIALGLILGILVALNVAIAIYGKKYPASCPLRKNRGLLGVFTGLLGGFVCCVPTFIIILGPAFSTLTVFFIRVRIFLIPLTLVLLTWGALWGLKRTE
ncbi:hypothetical protein PM10SUCC1_01990 [Propionigenium maris DSM 9537]|uniref:Uncharacterized protein n=1 Tax=Propionigenium maris DSM 9537 TaxID=1123000 RepID=A0A9W6GG77_9FUSO|nr:hypothetical protein [Propionigenium maris]GLI54684.1 hypothetical protein PM10SUCC1_01990 [Propionigenium maris DSM 9537]